MHGKQIMSPSVKIRLMCPGEEIAVCDLVTSTFQQDVAPLYTEEGIREFLSYASPLALQDRQGRNHLALVATRNESVVGFLELRDYRHISLLFVDVMHLQRGIGRLLVDEALQLIKAQQPETREVTVNASPNAVAAYQRFGFRATGDLQVKNGIGFVPMVLSLGSLNGG
jgi:predicted GNAT family N-acyltransferase